MFAIRPVFFADFRDLFDALFSSKLRVGTEFMHDFLRARGIIMSGHATRRELAQTIASFAYESMDLDEICDQLEVHSRADRVSYVNFDKTVDSSLISQALSRVKENRSDRYENINFDYVEGQRVAVEIDYFEIQEGRTALRQHLPKHGEIEFLKIGNSTRMRFPANQRVSEFAEELLSEIEKLTGPLEKAAISLAGLSKMERTSFFKILIGKLEGYKVTDVRKVNLTKEIAGVEFSDESFLDNDETEENSIDEPTTSTTLTKKEVEKEVKSVLKKASLDGSGILRANELKAFLTSGFFISRIVWKIEPKKKNGMPAVELEALLENPTAGTGFKYTVRGIYSYKINKTFATTKRKATEVERDSLLEKLEQAAQIAFVEAPLAQNPEV